MKSRTLRPACLVEAVSGLLAIRAFALSPDWLPSAQAASAGR